MSDLQSEAKLSNTEKGDKENSYENIAAHFHKKMLGRSEAPELLAINRRC